MSDHETGFEPTDPSDDDDLLSPERPDASAGGHVHEGSSAGGDEPEDAGEPPSEAEESEQDHPRSSHERQLVRAAWTLVVLVAVAGAIAAAELSRISTALNNTACIQRAQAELMGSTGPGVSPQYAGLGRLNALNQLKKCGQ